MEALQIVRKYGALGVVLTEIFYLWGAGPEPWGRAGRGPLPEKSILLGPICLRRRAQNQVLRRANQIITFGRHLGIRDGRTRVRHGNDASVQWEVLNQAAPSRSARARAQSVHECSQRLFTRAFLFRKVSADEPDYTNRRALPTYYPPGPEGWRGRAWGRIISRFWSFFSDPETARIATRPVRT